MPNLLIYKTIFKLNISIHINQYHLTKVTHNFSNFIS